MSIDKVGKREQFDFEVKDGLDRSWEWVMREAEKKACDFLEDLKLANDLSSFEECKFKFETVEVDLYSPEIPQRTYKFVLTVKIWKSF